MSRSLRCYVSQTTGSYHLISRVAGGEFLFGVREKEYFLKLLQRLAGGFFVRIHAFCIMSNHFHILATCMDSDSRFASNEELLERYQLIYPRNPGLPEGTYDNIGELVVPDGDGGMERLRNRLGSISRFMQELKQSFSRWYNKVHERKGYLWSDRFKGIIISNGEPQLLCSAYIDLNPVRAGIVEKPEDYRWSSLGLRVRFSHIAKSFLYPLAIVQMVGTIPNQIDYPGFEEPWLSPVILSPDVSDNVSLYREFAYRTGGFVREGSASISLELVNAVIAYHGKLGISDRFRYRLKNFSEGLAFGSYELIESLQKKLDRKHIRPRSFMNRDTDCTWSFSTRVLRA